MVTSDFPSDRILAPGQIVRRARDWRLYDQSSRRYTDFWQADGAAFLGHRPRGLARTVTAEIDRGLWAPLPSPWEVRLEKVLAALARRVGVAALTTGPAADRWRPLLVGAGAPLADAPPTDALPVAPPREGTLHVTLPFPLGPALDTGATRSPVILAGLVVAAGLLLRYLDLPEAQARLELAASLPVPPGYCRCGVYWVPCPDSAAAARDYESLRARALGLDLVLPPRAEDPICCPGELGRRERKNWEELCADRSG